MGRPRKTPQTEPQEAADLSNKQNPPKKRLKQGQRIAKLLEAKALNPSLTQRQLAKINNISQQSVADTLKRYGIDAKQMESFKQHRADILSGLQDTVLSTLSINDIKASSVRDRAVTFGVLYDKERLERGQSTSNVATILATAVIEAGKQWAKPVDNSAPTQDVVLEAIVVPV